MYEAGKCVTRKIVRSVIAIEASLVDPVSGNVGVKSGRSEGWRVDRRLALLIVDKVVVGGGDVAKG